MAALICFLLAGMILCFPGTTISASKSALSIWARDIVPSLFPYMVLCKMTAQRLRSARFPTAPLAALLGCMGGSPSGAAMLSVSSGGMAQSQLYALCALTGTISPMFFVGTLHAWGVAQKTCLCLLAAHGLGALSAFVCVRRLSPVRENVGKGKWKSDYRQRFFRAGRGRMHCLFQRGGCLHPYSFPVFAGNRVRLSAIRAGNRGRHAPADPNVKRILCARCEHGGADRLWRLVDFNAKPPLFAGVRRDAGAFALPRAAPGAHVRRGYGASPLAYMSHFRSASNACRSILLIWLWLTPMIFAVSFCVCSRT